HGHGLTRTERPDPGGHGCRAVLARRPEARPRFPIDSLTMTRSPSLTAPPVRLTLMGGSLVLAFGPLLAAHAGFLWQRPHYQHFPIVPLGAAYLAVRQLSGEAQFEPGTRRIGHLMLGAAWGLLAVAVLGWSPWLSMVAALALLPAVCYCLGGGPLV